MEKIYGKFIDIFSEKEKIQIKKFIKDFFMFNM